MKLKRENPKRIARELEILAAIDAHVTLEAHGIPPALQAVVENISQACERATDNISVLFREIAGLRREHRSLAESVAQLAADIDAMQETPPEMPAGYDGDMQYAQLGRLAEPYLRDRLSLAPEGHHVAIRAALALLPPQE